MDGPSDSSQYSFCFRTSISRLLLRLPHPTPRLNKAYLSSPDTTVLHPPGPSTLEVDKGLPTYSHSLCELLMELVSHIRPLLLGDYEWLEEGAIEAIDDHPTAAGGVANILVGTKGSRKVAIKQYRVYATLDYLPTYMRFYREVLAFSQLRDESFVPFVGVYSTPKYPMCLVFEYMDHCNLKEYLQEHNHVRRRELLLGVARAVEHLHSKGLVHKNLKITNILVDVHGRPRLGGLGAAFLPSDTPGVDIDRSFHGAAPELAGIERLGLTEAGATMATDVYAFGVLAFEVFAAGVPFSDETKIVGVLSMWKGKRPTRPHHPELSDNLWAMIEESWRVDPAQRITIRDVVVVLEMEVAAYQ